MKAGLFLVDDLLFDDHIFISFIGWPMMDVVVENAQGNFIVSVDVDSDAWRVLRNRHSLVHFVE